MSSRSSRTRTGVGSLALLGMALACGGTGGDNQAKADEVTAFLQLAVDGEHEQALARISPECDKPEHELGWKTQLLRAQRMGEVAGPFEVTWGEHTLAGANRDQVTVHFPSEQAPDHQLVVGLAEDGMVCGMQLDTVFSPTPEESQKAQQLVTQLYDQDWETLPLHPEVEIGEADLQGVADLLHQAEPHSAPRALCTHADYIAPEEGLGVLTLVVCDCSDQLVRFAWTVDGGELVTIGRLLPDESEATD